MATFILTLKRQRKESQGWSRAHGTLWPGCTSSSGVGGILWWWKHQVMLRGLHCWAFTVLSLLTGSWLSLSGCSAFLSYGGHRIFWLFAAWISVAWFGIPVFANHLSHTDTLPYSHTPHVYVQIYLNTQPCSKTHSWFVHHIICSLFVREPTW